MPGMVLLTGSCVAWQAYLPVVDLGGTAVAITAGHIHACAILVRNFVFVEGLLAVVLLDMS